MTVRVGNAINLIVLELSGGAVAGIMMMVAVGLTFYLNPEVVRLQELAFATRETDAKKTAYDAFFHYHWIARILYLINLGLGMTLLCMKVQKWVR